MRKGPPIDPLYCAAHMAGPRMEFAGMWPLVEGGKLVQYAWYRCKEGCTVGRALGAASAISMGAV